MTSELITTFVLSLIGCWLGAVALESFYTPKSVAVWKRPIKSTAIYLLMLTSLYCLVLIITQRFWFSVGVCLCLSTVVLIVNNAKYAALREPLVFSDVYLYLQVFQHPRLYLPFLGVLPVLGFLILCAMVILAGFFLEAPSFNWFSTPVVLLMLVSFFTFYLASKVADISEVSLQLKEDCQLHGVLPAALIYAFKAPRLKKDIANVIAQESTFQPDGIVPENSQTLADLVVIQSESFFDARVLSPNIKQHVLSGYDDCLVSSHVHGRLNVPAWGANTMRTEFGFLTGLTPDQIGVAQYYPYQQLLSVDIPSITGVLKVLGYHCVCVHPNASGFFLRDKFFKQLGFDEFIDIQSFEGAEKVGPYTSDQAVADKVQEVLSASSKPCFVFAITMENHGPLHLEDVQENEWGSYFETQPKSSLDELIIYLRHLKNADRMIVQLRDYFSKRTRETIFAFYGDHVPAISNVFDQLKYSNSRSNYFVWTNSCQTNEATERDSTQSVAQEMSIEELSVHLMDMIRGSESINSR